MREELMMRSGETLRCIRGQIHGYSQEQFAQWLGVSSGYISQIERRVVPQHIIEKLLTTPGIFHKNEIEQLQCIVIAEQAGINIKQYAPLDGHDERVLEGMKRRRDGKPPQAVQVFTNDVRSLDAIYEKYPSDRKRVLQKKSKSLLELIDTNTHIYPKDQIILRTYTELETLAQVQYALPDADYEYAKALPYLIQVIAGQVAAPRAGLQALIQSKKKRLLLTTPRALALSARAIMDTTLIALQEMMKQDSVSLSQARKYFRRQFEKDEELAQLVLAHLNDQRNLAVPPFQVTQFQAQIYEKMSAGWGLFGDIEQSKKQLEQAKQKHRESRREGGGGHVIAVQIDRSDFFSRLYNYPELGSLSEIEISAKQASGTALLVGHRAYIQVLDALRSHRSEELRKLGQSLAADSQQS